MPDLKEKKKSLTIILKRKKDLKDKEDNRKWLLKDKIITIKIRMGKNSTKTNNKIKNLN